MGLGQDCVLTLLEQLIKDAAVFVRCPLILLGRCDPH